MYYLINLLTKQIRMRIFTILFVFSFAFISCGDDSSIEDLPLCIQDELNTNFIPSACPGSGNLALWRFRGEDVYCFAYGDCIFDSWADIYDADCNYICLLGGATGNTICDGDDWETNAVEIEILYNR